MDEVKTCPFCAETIRAEAVKCRFCGSRVDGGVLRHTWYRQREGRRVAGVCAGLASELGISVTLLRLGFVLATLASVGWGIFIYLALWIIMPLRAS